MSRRSANRRDEILAAGEQIIRSRGVERASVEEVTSAAGIAKGTFYLYFNSKSDLLAALRARFAEQVVAAASQPAGSGQSGDWLARAEHLIGVVTDVHLENAELYLALFGEPAPAPSETEEAWSDEIVRLLTRFVDAGVAAGAFAVRDPDATALLLFHGVHGLLHEALRRPDVFDRERVLAASSDLVSRALTAASAPARAGGGR